MNSEETTLQSDLGIRSFKDCSIGYPGGFDYLLARPDCPYMAYMISPE